MGKIRMFFPVYALYALKDGDKFTTFGWNRSWNTHNSICGSRYCVRTACCEVVSSSQRPILMPNILSRQSLFHAENRLFCRLAFLAIMLLFSAATYIIFLKTKQRPHAVRIAFR